jgi:hypothetical protein
MKGGDDVREKRRIKKKIALLAERFIGCLVVAPLWELSFIFYHLQDRILLFYKFIAPTTHTHTNDHD